ncbi:hypothetical protein [Variovorax boronicumulans]|uniref:hypothetical protein n=1 Tax=Variovorax boronicumulans TaxID=436515 RepID=UPI002474CC79|nr:hypothetical protein [Variovorax boronicumulans]
MNSYRKTAEIFFLGFLGLMCSGCAFTVHELTVEKSPPLKVQTTAELLSALSEGFDAGVLGDSAFYRRRIGYEFSKFPKNRNDPAEFGYGTGEAIKMDAGEFNGLLAVLAKREIDEKRKIINIEFPTPGCLKQWEVERIFIRQFDNVLETVLFGIRPFDWPRKYKISAKYKNSEQSIILNIGEKSHCLQSVEISEIFN